MLFVPNHTTSKGSHIRDGVDLKRTMITVIIALVPALFYGMYNTGYQYYIQTDIQFTFIDAVLHGAYKIFPMIAVSYAVGLAIEFAFAVYRNHRCWSFVLKLRFDSGTQFMEFSFVYLRVVSDSGDEAGTV